MCINLVLKNLDYLHDMEKLELPKKILKDIFQQSKCYLELPKSSAKYFLLYRTNCKLFHEQDFVFRKQFVVDFKTTYTQFIDAWFAKIDFFIVFYDFKTTDNKFTKMCLKCMTFENEGKNFQRRYLLFKHKDTWKSCKFIQNAKSWCVVCKQVPLFQILTPAQFNDLYPIHVSEYNAIRYYNIKIPFIKTDYFEKGVKIKSEFEKNVVRIFRIKDEFDENLYKIFANPI